MDATDDLLTFRYDGRMPRGAPRSADVVIVSTYFDPSEKYMMGGIDRKDPQVKARTRAMWAPVREAIKRLHVEGFLFIYGLPSWLPYIAVRVNDLVKDRTRMAFKFWIGLEIDSAVRRETLPYAHMGLLMYMKVRTKGITPIRINTQKVRVPYEICPVCDQVRQDWGGKKHLRNPHGAALSDVWKDLPLRPLTNNIIPDDVLERILRLVERRDITVLHIIQDGPAGQMALPEGPGDVSAAGARGRFMAPERPSLSDEVLDRVLLGDSLRFMRRLRKQCPDGVFDMAFADPPYNIMKGYGRYTDSSSNMDYIEWCNRWLGLMADVLRPGGALLVLNLPRWAVHHATFLDGILDKRHWIVWDALSNPSGKVMPAHYALLYYTRPGGAITFNYERDGDGELVGPIDAYKYCLRLGCVNDRKEAGVDDKEHLTDVWKDIYRLKHRKDRDPHPCQLPDKLMKRIIALTTHPGDVVFDPFCGTGRTAIAATMLGRHFVTMDIDPKYVDIARSNLRRLRPSGNGDLVLPRSRVSRGERKVTRKEVEVRYIGLCRSHGRVLEIDDVYMLDPGLALKIDEHYPSLGKLKSVARRRL